jgi:lanosterol synthase
MQANANTAVPAAAPTPKRAERRALESLVSLQQPSGCWEGEMVWNTMILSQYVIVRRVIGRPFDEKQRAQILKNFTVTQRSDGSWGMHSESEGYVFFTTLAYVALRLLGLPADDPKLAAARKWLRAQPGGVLSIPSWGKYWLSFVGLYGYEGVNPCPPELYALPEWVPVHPSRYYCHVRNIYMGLAYLYGSRVHGDLGVAMTADLRRELYEQPYEAIDFAKHRNDVAESDLVTRPSLGVKAAMELMYQHERVHSKKFRARALDHVFERILYEQHTSNYQGISPVNSLLNLFSIWARDPKHPEMEKSLAGIEAWRWDDEREGTRYCGARSNTWDTAFAMQAILAAPENERSVEALQAGYRYLLSVQMLDELPEWKKMHRDPMRGGWTFSDGKHRWPVSDCTAEALCAILLSNKTGAAPSEKLSEERVRHAVEFILLRQNDDGGFGTYERRRGGQFLDHVNNTEMYGDCMSDKSHPECSASSVASLCMVREHYPQMMRARIDEAITRGVAFLRTTPDPDGGIRAAWGIHYSYGAFQVVKGLRAAGVPRSDEILQRAARHLISIQRSDGGWGESYKGCIERRYIEHPQSQPVMTAWALLALLEVLPVDDPAIVRGVAWLRAHQNTDGSFPEGALNGVFFDSAMLDYRLYRSYFPAWALGRHAALSQSPT